MNTKLSLSVFLGLLAGGLGFAGSAQAFSFQTNLLNEDYNPRGDVWLNSVEVNGNIFSNFAFVDRADILYNDPYTGGNTGAASSDMGPLATVGRSVEDPTNEDIVASLGNNNLNSIIDGEDRGSFAINVWFDRRVDNLFLWERGMNSAVTVQAIDGRGNSLGNTFTITKDRWDNAGFRINTMEIGRNVQDVGSWGVSLADLGLDPSVRSIGGIRVSAAWSESGGPGDDALRAFYNGPDWKVVGAAVPEPGMIFGLGAIGAGFVASNLRKKANKA
ncbi:exosortase-dependent surface protein XDP2 [Arthrospira platensis]|uniref:exosortase-dependent surface protein XDP2 n=1 Tax=Limnospira TaxID=2596745 RepID=UPI0001C3902E|nr:exosortase-dependent surface protein XDP2 [Arthrospira platensis]AMW28357.1 PEP-CTERM exosortase interaction domain-containing protein [Arthrospira platensis YZ]MBD2671145.1 PEP-CTERM sorting domain-containing protein [Arthrospira platensis FACHB-439]MBD2712338.1 PEP-CTERM sorting domain-containing protein [Arthrospira platensis FACHB-835]MDT9312748.1 PEP-CTERM sorting domain-containing protein [Limnospira sp. Paracas R14]QQW31158.1 PEP-CTERM sorting domain-containing protein [Arthrospira s